MSSSSLGKAAQHAPPCAGITTLWGKTKPGTTLDLKVGATAIAQQQHSNSSGSTFFDTCCCCAPCRMPSSVSFGQTGRVDQTLDAAQVTHGLQWGISHDPACLVSAVIESCPFRNVSPKIFEEGRNYYYYCYYIGN